ncbi:hypothetical protein [Kitasatospora viridis]|uniref:Uncharacterized protein n=1 Tax=Kitasatospora viridis TaxID=281105 RepID=A0A561T6S3_9ACTN|nr:hypothetical protein [Kitasatospora viridis]TWF82821.1 hypothetical protein FHX73_14303 [Kitasatospora viridis]
MTRYCVDPERHELIATWSTGGGSLATRITGLPATAEPTLLLRLARALTQLSAAAWATYTHPASSAGSLDSESEGWRREQERQAFAEVARALTDPHLPQDGSLTVSYSPLIESAHRAGRALHVLAERELTAAVLAEAATELAAVEQAELGDLTGRAQQAVALSREGASPAQVAAADRLLDKDPFGPATIFSVIDPTAAAVAAAHWLGAAAQVAAEVSGEPPAEVVLEADAIEELPHETPTLVLELLEAGVSPYDTVTGLVRHAMLVADGTLPDPSALREQLEALEEDLADCSEEERAEALGPGLRLTPLDPRRPARDLLEDLLAGIHGCWLLFDDHTEHTEPVAAGDEEGERAEQYRSRERFAGLVRERAAAHRDRLI